MLRSSSGHSGIAVAKTRGTHGRNSLAVDIASVNEALSACSVCYADDTEGGLHRTCTTVACTARCCLQCIQRRVAMLNKREATFHDNDTGADELTRLACVGCAFCRQKPGEMILNLTAMVDNDDGLIVPPEYAVLSVLTTQLAANRVYAASMDERRASFMRALEVNKVQRLELVQLKSLQTRANTQMAKNDARVDVMQAKLAAAIAECASYKQSMEDALNPARASSNRVTEVVTDVHKLDTNEHVTTTTRTYGGGSAASMFEVADAKIVELTAHLDSRDKRIEALLQLIPQNRRTHVKNGPTAESEPEIELELEAEGELEADVELDAEVELEAEVELDAEVELWFDIEVEAELEIEAEPEVELELLEVEPDMETLELELIWMKSVKRATVTDDDRARIIKLAIQLKTAERALLSARGKNDDEYARVAKLTKRADHKERNLRPGALEMRRQRDLKRKRRQLAATPTTTPASAASVSTTTTTAMDAGPVVRKKRRKVVDMLQQCLI
jgi:hypothetical protein